MRNEEVTLARHRDGLRDSAGVSLELEGPIVHESDLVQKSWTGLGERFSMLKRKRNERGLPRTSQCPKMANVGPSSFLLQWDRYTVWRFPIDSRTPIPLEHPRITNIGGEHADSIYTSARVLTILALSLTAVFLMSAKGEAGPPGRNDDTRQVLKNAGVDKYLGEFTATESAFGGWTKHTFDPQYIPDASYPSGISDKG